MNYHNAKFLASYGASNQLPPSVMPEIAFVGRSNVGKSTLLNRLTYRNNLAKTSSTPGKTSTINFYEVDTFHFVDLPGYGYAKVSKQEKGRWSELIEGYFNQTRIFTLIVCLIDIRHNPSKEDVHMVKFLTETEMHFVVVLTKLDKISKQQAIKQKNIISKQLGLPKDFNVITTSSQNGFGIEQLRHTIKSAIDNAETY